jgi:hypothetical protein
MVVCGVYTIGPEKTLTIKLIPLPKLRPELLLKPCSCQYGIVIEIDLLRAGRLSRI